MRKFLNIILLSLFAGAVASCCKDETPEIRVRKKADHTLVMYLVADNNLYANLSRNVRQAAEAVASGALSAVNGRIAVYFDPNPNVHNPVLFTITEQNGKAVYDTVKRYGSQLSTDKAVMTQVCKDIRSLLPSESYGISLGSHATGWVPAAGNDLAMRSGSLEQNLWLRPQGALLTRAFGLDRQDGTEYHMDIADLSEGLSPIEWSYILTDACFMSSVEALYELRGRAPYIVASPTEIMSDGFPYAEVVYILFESPAITEQTLTEVCNAYMRHYRNADVASASIALVRTSELETLAAAVKDLLDAGTRPVDAAQIQAFEGLSPHVFYDLDHYVENLSNDAARYEAFTRALASTVLFKESTPRIYSAFKPGYFPVTRYCGLSSYIENEEFPIFNGFYRNTAWYAATHSQSEGEE